METAPTSSDTANAVTIRPLREEELDEADRIMRLAFGSFLGLPDPLAFGGDAGLVRTRWHADPSAAVAAELDGELAGTNFAANWGSFGLFGPLTVRPDLWDRGIGRHLLAATMPIFERWGTRQVGLFTFPQSPKHLGLYQSFGFWPRFLTPLMSKGVGVRDTPARWSRYGELPKPERAAALAACRELAGTISPGLDLTREIHAAQEQGLGDTVLLEGDGQLDGFAVCHCGAGSEAGSGTCYVKFGAARPGPSAGDAFARLLDACEAVAAAQGLAQLAAGVNSARGDAYRLMLARGFRTDFVGVAMTRAGEAAHDRPDVYAVDDWR